MPAASGRDAAGVQPGRHGAQASGTGGAEVRKVGFRSAARARAFPVFLARCEHPISCTPEVPAACGHARDSTIEAADCPAAEQLLLTIGRSGECAP